MNLFRLDASILPGASASAEIADIAQAEWTAAHPDGTVTRRRLGTDSLPTDAWALATVAGFTPETDRTPAQREALALASTLAEEVQGADAAILAVPLYNYGISQHFKTWVDLVISAAGPTTPLLKGTPTVLVTVMGGGYGPGTPREGWDHSTPYLERVLDDMWGADLTIIKRELTLAETTPGMEELREFAQQQRSDALSAAREAGRLLAGR
ncbi:FMN-dependent NADH-azoreductase [Streptomyces sp. SAI-208]|uniref:FMN-dependent NADH-azoreductase n=1 Tax=unclassified Streptomyces TaxID=2593676 RepID=UPI0024765D58|nr:MULTISPECIES: NAD(P)H-dependent oxidoreductase [unclassified Streptomyces]MDH6513817.1 FMN-dependent NADH-azoreductase [Streptomyces sp. SAI-090]MDH6565077.1 FMN-dependent NADH-azoreductase [Streptomyces sp. SAI-117]MDH6604665.1 FMN-dependent NADH-azoreductase [Streptomyces sp. SAI-208]MDH6622103.1 FMN-dependent NADH-azoreductase [Streptomyces sp. SAI-135]